MSTTTTTTTPTTATTTTTPSPLQEVITTFISSTEGFEITQQTSASDNAETINTSFAKSSSFGTIAPGETSKNIIIQLNIPNVRGIANIKLALVALEGIEFENNIFGISKDYLLRDDIVPNEYFQGINTDNSPTNSYNISIANIDNNASEYVYLNLTLPLDSITGVGIIRLKWYYDYAGEI